MPSLIHQFQNVNNILIEQDLRAFRPEIAIAQFYTRLCVSGAIKAWVRFKKIEALEEKIENKLRKWCRIKIPSHEPVNFNTAQDKTALVKKVRIFKLTITILMIAAAVIGGLSIVLTPLVFLIPHLIIPLIGITYVISLSLSLASLILFTKTNEQSREKRVNISQNFQEFIEKYLIGKIGFVPSSIDLIDSKLHEVYCEWKKEAKFILKS